MRTSLLPGALLALLFSMAFPGEATAHKVNVFAYVESGEVFIESYFPDGRPVAEGRVSVYDGSGDLLLEGTTDETGRFRFPIPPTLETSDLRIVIEASMGHRASFELRSSEVEAGR